MPRTAPSARSPAAAVPSSRPACPRRPQRGSTSRLAISPVTSASAGRDPSAAATSTSGARPADAEPDGELAFGGDVDLAVRVVDGLGPGADQVGAVQLGQGLLAQEVFVGGVPGLALDAGDLRGVGQVGGADGGVAHGPESIGSPKTVGGGWHDDVIMQTISVATARKTFLAAQGFADPRPSGVPSRRHLKRVLSRVQLLQLDSVNVAVRAHYMPVFSRLGSYDPALLDSAAWSHSAKQPRLLVETWAHEASLLPVEDWPLIRSGAKRDGWWKHYGPLIEKSPGLVDEILSVVKELGPIGAGGIERQVEADAQRRGPGSWWERSEVKRVCEYLFGVGQLTTGTRRSFERLYDLTERVVPPEILAVSVSADEGARGLIERSARALGVATETDLRDYYRLGPAPARQAVAELVESGVLEPVAVRGWKAPAYRHFEARTPARSPAARCCARSTR